jgi:hypothetical protein
MSTKGLGGRKANQWEATRAGGVRLVGRGGAVVIRD